MVAKCDNKEWGYGYDASVGEYTDLMKSGVLDPAKVGCKHWCSPLPSTRTACVSVCITRVSADSSYRNRGTAYSWEKVEGMQAMLCDVRGSLGHFPWAPESKTLRSLRDTVMPASTILFRLPRLIGLHILVNDR